MPHFELGFDVFDKVTCGQRMIDNRINVVMSWQAFEAVAYLDVPGEMAELLRNTGHPDFTTPMPVESAVSYALFLSMRTFTPMHLTGDLAVWSSAWGKLPPAAI